MADLYQYGVAATLTFPLIGSATAAWTTAAAGSLVGTNIRISKDGGAWATSENTGTALPGLGFYRLVVTATEMQAADIMISIGGSGASLGTIIEAQAIHLVTYGSANARYPGDWPSTLMAAHTIGTVSTLAAGAISSAAGTVGAVGTIVGPLAANLITSAAIAASAIQGTAISATAGTALGPVSANIVSGVASANLVQILGAAIPANASAATGFGTMMHRYPTATVLVGQIADNAITSAAFTATALIDQQIEDVAVATGTALIKGIWDRVLNGALHNINLSAGKRLREVVDAEVILSGTITGTGANWVEIATEGTNVDEYYQNLHIVMEDGTAAGQVRAVESYTGANARAVVRNWAVVPQIGDAYELVQDADAHVSLVHDNAITSASFIANAIQATAISTTAFSTLALGTVNLLGANAITTASYTATAMVLQTVGTVSVAATAEGTVNAKLVLVGTQAITNNMGTNFAIFNNAEGTITAKSIDDVGAAAPGGTLDANIVQIMGSTIPAAASAATNWGNFFNSDGTLSSQVMDDVGGGGIVSANIVQVLGTAASGTEGTLGVRVNVIRNNVITSASIAGSAFLSTKFHNNYFEDTRWNTASMGTVGTALGTVNANVVVMAANVITPAVFTATALATLNQGTIDANVIQVLGTAASGSAGTLGVRVNAFVASAINNAAFSASAIGSGKINAGAFAGGKFADSFFTDSRWSTATMTNVTAQATVNAMSADVITSASIAASAIQGTAISGTAGTAFGIMSANVLQLNGSATAAQKMASHAHGIGSGTVDASPAPSTTAFESAALQGSVDTYKGRIVVFLDGTMHLEATDVLSNATTGTMVVTTMTVAPAAGQAFILV